SPKVLRTWAQSCLPLSSPQRNSTRTTNRRKPQKIILANREAALKVVGRASRRSAERFARRPDDLLRALTLGALAVQPLRRSPAGAGVVGVGGALVARQPPVEL